MLTEKIYDAGNCGLIEGDWEEWPAQDSAADAARHNAAALQALLDEAGQCGGGTVVLPEGTYCVSGDPSVPGGNVLVIRYDNITLTGQGKDENGKYKTRLKTNYKWDGPRGIFRSTGILINGEPPGSGKARQNIVLSHFEMDGGYGWTGKSDWGFDPTMDYGWDINHKGINVCQDTLVTHVKLEDLYVHRYSGETVYIGGKLVGYLEVADCTLSDTNASCFNLYAAYLNVHGNRFGEPGSKCRFWIEYCARASFIDYELPPIPEGLEKDHAYFRNNTFYHAVSAHGVAIAQGDCTTYAITFEDNYFENSLSDPEYGLFQFAGAVYGPVVIRNNVVENSPGPLLIFDYGGGTEPTDHLVNKNITFEGNRCSGLGGPFISLTGTWGIWDAVHKRAIPAVQYVENLVVRNNRFKGSMETSKSVAVGSSRDSVESCIHLKDVRILENLFENCTTPETLGVFLGKNPLFSGNKYVHAGNTGFGGRCSLTPGDNMLRPVFEHLEVHASETVQVAMKTGKYEDGQQITLTGGPHTAPLIFDTDGRSFVIPERIQMGPGDLIAFQYRADRGKWIFRSFTPVGHREENEP